MKKLIQALWILKESVLIFHQDYGSIDIEDDLFSGLLSAIVVLGKETVGRKIHSIVMEDLKFIFEKNSDFYFIICSDKDDNNILLHKKLIRIQIHFIHEYHDIIPTWEANTSIFNTFREKAEKIIAFSIEGTVMYCEYCEKKIVDEFITKKIGLHDFYFCNNICQEHLEDWYSNFIINLDDYLRRHQTKH